MTAVKTDSLLLGTARPEVLQARSNFREGDPQTAFLLPPSVDNWLPERHLAPFIAEEIDGLDLVGMIAAYRGSGLATHHPRMLLGVLIYGHAPHGSARQIARGATPVRQAARGRNPPV